MTIREHSDPLTRGRYVLSLRVDRTLNRFKTQEINESNEHASEDPNLVRFSEDQVYTDQEGAGRHGHNRERAEAKDIQIRVRGEAL